MKALRLAAYGDAVALADLAAPVPQAGQVLVRVAAASLNPLDAKLQTGAMHDHFPLGFPHVVGTDLAGTVAVLGPEVTGWQVGDRVVARTDPTTGGAVAELAAVPASALVRIPDGLDPIRAAALATAAGTAWQALVEIAAVRPGQTVLVHAGAGGVGGFAIQIARAAGARVVASASGDGLDIVRRLGADAAIDHRAEDFATHVAGVDVVLDTIGGDTQRRSFGVLRPGGLLLCLTSPPDAALATAHGVTAAFVFHRSDAGRLGQVVAAAAEGRLQVLLDRVVPLGEAAAALAHLATGRARGKVVVTP